MHCPVCSFEDTKVLDSRLSDKGAAIRRRRECEKCGFRFTTNELVEILALNVIKRDGAKELYDREKITSGLRKALEKRSYTEEDFRSLVNRIERDIQKRKKDEITSTEIGELIMNRLLKFDKVAYVRFASVYRAFEDVNEFTRELNKLKNKKK